MITVVIPPPESFDNATQQFVYGEGATLRLEHSLVSLSKWEGKYEKPFISEEKKTAEETFDYIKAMSLDGEISDEVLKKLTPTNIREINEYIEAKMTATFFADDTVKKAGKPPVITAEIIYQWMVALQMPIPVMESWHLNRLITQIKVINRKNEEAAGGKKKKGLTKEDLASRSALNAKRRAEAEAARNS